MQLFPVVESIKAPGHEMPPVVLFEYPALTHGDFCVACHIVIGIFDYAVPFWVLEFFIPVALNTIKFKQPILISFTRRDLTGEHFIG